MINKVCIFTYNGIEHVAVASHDNLHSSYEVMIYRSFFSSDREVIDNKEFENLIEFRKYVEAKYSIIDRDWRSDFCGQCNYIFNYTVSKHGVLGIYPTEKISPHGLTVKLNEQKRSLQIYGNSSNLRSFANSILSIIASSEFDENPHIHLEGQGDDGVDLLLCLNPDDGKAGFEAGEYLCDDSKYELPGIGMGVLKRDIGVSKQG